MPATLTIRVTVPIDFENDLPEAVFKTNPVQTDNGKIHRDEESSGALYEFYLQDNGQQYYKNRSGD